MPIFNYSVANFVALTLGKSSDVNTRYQDIATFFNVTGLDDTNFAANGLSRTKLKADTANTLVINSNTGAISNLSQTVGQLLTSAGNANTLFGANELGINNYSLAVSVASNNLTFTINDAGGSTPSSTSPVVATLRNATSATGTPVTLSATSAFTLKLNNGSTLGQPNSSAMYFYLYLGNNAGAPCLLVSSTYYDHGSTVAAVSEGTGTATSRISVYSDVSVGAIASTPILYLGRVLAPQSTAGTYTSGATEITPYYSRIVDEIYRVTTTFNSFGLINGVPTPYFNTGSYTINNYNTSGTNGSAPTILPIKTANYIFSANIQINNGASTQHQALAYKNAVQWSVLNSTVSDSSGDPITRGGTDILSVSSGDTLQTYFISPGTPNSNGVATYNYESIFKAFSKKRAGY